MRVEDLPVVGDVLAAGAEDRVFDGLLIAGPVVVLVIVILGRSVLTQGLAVAYVGAFLAHVLRLAIQSGD